jgi:hypothetical protein
MAVPIPPPREIPRVPPFAAFVEGWRRVLRAPAVLLGTWAIWWALAGLLSTTVAPAPSLGRVHFAPARGLLDRWVELVAQDLQHLSGLFTPEMWVLFQPAWLLPSLLAALGLQALLAIFLSGGILDRYARGRPIGTAAFFAACGVYFFRFLRLTAMALALGYAVVRLGQALPAHPAVHVAVVVTAAALALIVDFAKARAVVEDRRSMIGALAAATRFVRRRVWRVLGLAFFNALALLAVLRIQFQIAVTPAPPWFAVMLAAALLLLAIAARLAFMASEVVFFQGELAHAGYTAAPLPVWPDSPAVEAMENLRRQGPSADGLRSTVSGSRTPKTED